MRKVFSILAPYGRFIEIGKRDIDADHALRLKPFNRNLLFAAIDLDRLLLDRPDEIAPNGRRAEGFVPARSIVTAANHGLSRKGRLRKRVPAVSPGETYTARSLSPFRVRACQRAAAGLGTREDSRRRDLSDHWRLRRIPDSSIAAVTGGSRARALVLVSRREALVTPEALEAVAAL